MKDLKRQLQQMQKREEKLQDQLSALRGIQGVDHRRGCGHVGVARYIRGCSTVLYKHSRQMDYHIMAILFVIHTRIMH